MSGFDTYAIFRNGTGCPDIVTTNPENILAPDIAVPWVPVGGDLDATHYKLVDGTLVYDPPEEPAPAPITDLPDLEGFTTAVFQNESIPTQARLELAQKFPLIRDYLYTKPETLAQYWAGMKALAGTALTA